MKSWQLPDYISDILPPKAGQLEKIKGEILALFYGRGYQLVTPPLIEYTNSLLLNQDEGLSTKTLQLTDQLSGRQIGVRADMTTQIVRIDSHLSPPDRLSRFCYAGAVLYAAPQALFGNREPLQIGAELFGHKGVGADIEIIELMLDCVQILPAVVPMLSISHIDIVNSLLTEAQIPAAAAANIIRLLIIKDCKELGNELDKLNLDPKIEDSLLALPTLYGHEEVLATAAKKLLLTARIEKALEEMTKISRFFKDYPIYIDLAELRKDQYHTGLLFGVYADGWSNLIARGGRYDNLGAAFGEARPATGFSLDLKDFLDTLPLIPPPEPIKVKVGDYAAALDIIKKLRAGGEVVLIEYENQETTVSPGGGRRLIYENNRWTVKQQS